eukprot:628573-Pelagomonas_calceolata.AAC.4
MLAKGHVAHIHASANSKCDGVKPASNKAFTLTTSLHRCGWPIFVGGAGAGPKPALLPVGKSAASTAGHGYHAPKA